MKYLGIWLTKLPQDLLEENFVPLWSALQRDLAEWKTLKISWFGKISILKMNVLPRMLYLFQTVPIHIPPAYFSMIQADCTRFVWNDTRPRISYCAMTRPKRVGGLAVPDFHLYYQASHLLLVVEWTGGGRHALWQDLELGATPHPTGVLPWIDPARRSPQVHRHPYIGTTLRVWRSTMRRASLSTYPSPLLPLEDNPAFPAGVHPLIQHRLGGARWPRAFHFLSGQDLSPPWDNRLRDNSLSMLERFNFTQISHYLRSLPARDRLLHPCLPFEELAKAKHPISHGISMIYRILQMAVGEPSLTFEHTWEQMLDATITEAQWKDTYELAHRGSPQTRLQSNS
uniref:Uncharacterized protein n=1 Tax=Leptobrachium leishanense TaxID=445787 RepID=A0A8C5LWN9_9ANUR